MAFYHFDRKSLYKTDKESMITKPTLVYLNGFLKNRMLELFLTKNSMKNIVLGLNLK